MFISFDMMPDESKLWIYPIHRSLTDEEKNTISQDLFNFTNQWQAHQQDLRASFMIWGNHFILVAVDNQFHEASGCSIDHSVHFLKSLQEKMNLDFFDRQHIFIKSGDLIQTIKIAYVKESIANDTLSPETILYNTLCLSIGEWKEKAFIKADQSWIKRFFVLQTA
jgi:hypothetical protein